MGKGKKQNQAAAAVAADVEEEVVELPRSGETKAQRKQRLEQEAGASAAVDQRKLPPTILKLQRQLYQAIDSIQRLETGRQAQVHQKMLQYKNVPTQLDEADTKWTELAPGKWIRYEQYETDKDMPAVIDLFTKHLTEPYTVFTYNYFIHSWPDLCIMLFGAEQKEKPSEDSRGNMIGCIVSKVAKKKTTMNLRGYIAMLAVEPLFRGHRLGAALVSKSLKLMEQKKCTEVWLETPTNNERALGLYTSIGFATTKYLKRYYMDGSDAVRLKLWLDKNDDVEEGDEPTTAQEAVKA